MQEAGYLSTLKPALPTFERFEYAPTSVRELWKLLNDGDVRPALELSRNLMRGKSFSDRDTLATLLNAAAVAEFRTGNVEQAQRLAKRSAGIVENQWMAHAIRLTAFAASAGPKAYRYFASIKLADQSPVWDEPPARSAFYVLGAALAWQNGFWDDVAKSLEKAFPAGVATMPDSLRSDCFRLAFYREQPADASAAARALLGSFPLDQLDSLLNAMVQHGWTAEALPLYREAYKSNETSQLLRRRLVGLCIREGELEEARTLAADGALNILV
jgi:hypothetical protein